jgi:hypothetical protein
MQVDLPRQTPLPGTDCPREALALDVTSQQALDGRGIWLGHRAGAATGFGHPEQANGPTAGLERANSRQGHTELIISSAATSKAF